MSAQAAQLARIEIGDVVVTYLPDGQVGLDHRRAFPQSYHNLDGDSVGELFDEHGGLLLSIGGLLVETTRYKALIDLGAGPVRPDLRLRVGESRGRLLDSLATAGSSPDEITHVVLTHLHRDHVGWTCAETELGPRPAFPDATFHIARAEWEFWTDPDRRTHPDGPRPEHYTTFAASLHLFEPGEVLLPYLATFPTPGHTPGHTSLIISRLQGRLIAIGDAVHSPVELTRPDMRFAFDVDQTLAEQSRIALRRELAEDGTRFAGAHFPNHMFGRMARTDDGITTNFGEVAHF